MLESDNYPYWKERMKAYIKSINEKAWRFVLTTWQAPTIDTDARKVPKFEIQWTIEEERVANVNSKALYAKFCGIDM
ncbi:hypothetical protein PVK06_029763 [Gossypium arboreum]|uniref:Gag-pol polyprotein n=1 Tax=Gossypium arboreum TaxID=29729 RepID=A0ABR0NNQ6_GOSAR|nr:hypothetical protein PVK06_029763 [Gossypium arboreum]